MCGCRAMADPVFAAHVVGARSCACASSPPQIAGVLPTFRTPSDVREQKTKIDALMKSVDAAVQQCAALPPVRKQAWLNLWNSWVMYRDGEDSWWHAAAQYDRGTEYEREARAWHDELVRAACESGGPIVKPPDEAGSADIVSALKLGAVAVIVAAAVYGVSRFV